MAYALRPEETSAPTLRKRRRDCPTDFTPGARRFQTFVVPHGGVPFNPPRSAAHLPRQLFRTRATGLPTPQVNGQLAGDGNNRSLPSAGCCARIEQDMVPFLHQAGLGLVLHQSPRQQHQGGTQTRVATLVDSQHPQSLTTTGHTGTETGVTAHLATIGEAMPVAPSRRITSKVSAPKPRGRGDGACCSSRRVIVWTCSSKASSSVRKTSSRSTNH
jgi:hypothetical protein